MKFSRHILLSLALLTSLASPAQANVTSVSATPSQRTVNADRPVSLVINWMVRGSGATAPVTIDLDDGLLFLRDPNGTLVDTINTNPGRTLTSVGAGGTYNVTISETLTLSQSVIDQAKAARLRLYYLRQFSDDGFTTNRTAAVLINLGGGIGSSLDVSRVRVSFDNGSTLCSTDSDSTLVATARLQTEGSGLLRGEWQIRTDQPDGAFRPLRQVQTMVSAGRDITFSSPPLPTNESGRLDVRFHLITPEVAFTEPTATCLIRSGGHLGLVPAPGRLAELVSPAPYSPLSATTEIQWNAIPEAQAYRIEVLPGPDKLPVAAQEVPASSTSAKLSPVVLERLASDRRYLLRVIAR